MQIILIFTRKVEYLASLWKWAFLELGSGLLCFAIWWAFHFTGAFHFANLTELTKLRGIANNNNFGNGTEKLPLVVDNFFQEIFHLLLRVLFNLYFVFTFYNQKINQWINKNWLISVIIHSKYFPDSDWLRSCIQESQSDILHSFSANYYFLSVLYFFP